LKTLVVTLDGKTLAVGGAPVASRLDLKRIARAVGAKKAAMAGHMLASWAGPGQDARPRRWVTLRRS
jgi:prolyl-tRNA editing enzyme YbaK/EbsC (Cys-tRNA(Pro) deacylase)